MTAYSPYFVGNYKVGLETDLDPYLIPEDAFPTLENAYLWRGRVLKKGGYDLLGRLGIRMDTAPLLPNRTAGADTYNVVLNYPPIEPGTIVITDGVTTFTDNGTGGFVITPVAGNGTVLGPTNYATGAINIRFNVGNAGAAVTATYIVLPNNNSPVMGLRTRDVANTNQEHLIGFDMQFAYEYNNATNQFDHLKFFKGNLNAVTWHGSNSDFFYSCNFQNAFFETNNVPGFNVYTVTNVTVNANAQITIGANTLQIGDWVYLDYVVAAAPNRMVRLTGQVTAPGNPITTNIDTSTSGAYVNSGRLWSLTNFIAGQGDGIRWYDGTGWVNFEPPLDFQNLADAATPVNPRVLQGALMVVPYKGRMVALNTFEGTSLATQTQFRQRARFSALRGCFFTPWQGAVQPAGFPLPAGISNPTGGEWIESPGNGGFVDAPTNEDIVAAEFIKDTLVVYFEYSTWALLYTGNPTQPFDWQKINTEIGSESTFSPIPFDRGILSIAPSGAYICDSVNIERIDRIIPDEVFSFLQQNNGYKRIQGIRDFYSEQVFWTYLSEPDDSTETRVFPSRILVYNYVNPSFSIFKNSFTTFGYYNFVNNLTWGNAGNPWSTYNIAWNSFAVQTAFPIIVAGNQQGYVFNLRQNDGDTILTNDISLTITAITAANPSVFTVPNHNLEVGDFIRLSNVNGMIPDPSGNIYQVRTTPSSDTFTLTDQNDVTLALGGAYTFGGKVIIIDNFNITTKNLNPHFQEGLSMRMGYADFFFKNNSDDPPDIDEALITVELYQNQDTVFPVQTQTIDLNDQYDVNNSLSWIRVYFDGSGQFLSINFTLSTNFVTPQTPIPGQIFDPASQNTIVDLHGMIMWMKRAGRLLTNAIQ